MSRTRRGDPPKQDKQLRAETAERLEAIVEAAERAAEKVIDDAEAQARRYITQARAEADRLADERPGELSGLIETLLRQAASLREEAERLQSSLEAAQTRFGAGRPDQLPLADDADQPAAAEPDPAPSAPRLRAVPGEEDPSTGTRADRPSAAGARLLATQMAVSGSSREEIEACLRNRFAIEDTGAILDAILGPED